MRWLFPPNTLKNPAPWDQYWRDHISHGVAGLVHMFCDDGELVDVMRANQLKTILLVGALSALVIGLGAAIAPGDLYLFAGLALATGRRVTWPMLRRSLPGGMLFGINLTVFFQALKFATVGMATVFAALVPVLALIAGRALFGEHITRLAVLCAAAAVGGVVIFVVPSLSEPGNTTAGVLLSLLAVLIWVSYLLVTKRARQGVGTVEYLLCMSAVAAVTLVPFMVLFTDEGVALPEHGWGWIVLLALAVIVLTILVVLILPLPPILLDMALALSIILAVLILMTALFIHAPLEFSAFPTVLLIATIMRLALNLASSRLVLAQGHEGTTAAGHVIEVFGNFVVQGLNAGSALGWVISALCFVFLIFVNALELLVGGIQAYVFALLTALYINDAVHLH